MLGRTLGVAAAAFAILANASVADAQGRTPVPLKSVPGAIVHSVQLANTSGAPVNIEVVTACVGTVATFKIVNIGEAWPRLGKLGIYRGTPENMKPLSKRSMRFAAGQKASFRLKNVGTDTVAVFVEPSWYDRPFKFDAEVKCG